MGVIALSESLRKHLFYDGRVELCFNLVWLVLSAALFAGAWRSHRRGSLPSAPFTAFTAVFALCMILLPVISLSDDLLQAHEHAQPLAAQTWHLASENSSTGLDPFQLVLTWMQVLSLLFAAAVGQLSTQRPDRKHACLIWLTRAQRLRPPPVFA